MQVSIPLELQAENDGAVPHMVERAGETKVMFKLLTKKNNKATTKELEVRAEGGVVYVCRGRS